MKIHSIRLLTWLWLVALFQGTPAHAIMGPPSLESIEVSQVMNSKELSTAEKVSRLRELSRKDETRWGALHRLNSIDAAAAREDALTFFRSADTPRQSKLKLVHFLLADVRPQQEGFPQEIVAECASYLIKVILDGGEAEFCQKLEESTTTAVGEYAYLASDLWGYKGVNFTPFKDARVVPILIRCLNAPDNVYAKRQGGVIRGESGESTGRNTARMQIPLALAKIGDAQAIQPLDAVLFRHADICQRINSAYALARLIGSKDDRAATGRKLLAQPELIECRLPFGKGLIEAGDDAGVDFLSLKLTGGSVDQRAYPHVLCFCLNERCEILRGFKSPKVEDFVREVLECQPWFDLVLFKPGSAKIENAWPRPVKDDAEALAQVAPRIIKAYGVMLECVKLNRLKGLSGKLEEIAKQSRNEQIRQMTEECLNEIR